MGRHDRPSSFSTAALYRLATKAHTLLPYYLSWSGYAFPAWHYYLEMTRCCNLRCVMCQYIQWLRETPASKQMEGDLTTEEWLRVIEQIPRFALVTFTGGEPFMRKDFMQLLERASARTRTHVITNGTLVTEDRARRCVELAPKRVGGVGLNFAGVSIDGPAEVQDQIRGMPEGFAKSASGVKMLAEFRREAGKACPLVHVTTVIQKANLDHLAEMPRVVADMGGDVLNFTLETRSLDLPGFGEADPGSFRTSDIQSPRLDAQRLADALQQTRANAARLGIDLRMPDMPDEEIVRYYSGENDLRDFRCGSLWTNLVVGADGRAYGCWLQEVGHIRDSSLKEIWNGLALRAFRKRTRQGLYPPCAGCCFLVHHPRRR